MHLKLIKIHVRNVQKLIYRKSIRKKSAANYNKYKLEKYAFGKPGKLNIPRYESNSSARDGNSDQFQKAKHIYSNPTSPNKNKEIKYNGSSSDLLDFMKVNKRYVKEMSNINRDINPKYNCLTDVPRTKVPKPKLVMKLAKHKSLFYGDNPDKAKKPSYIGPYKFLYQMPLINSKNK